MPGFEIIDETEKNAVCKIFDEGGVLFAHGFANIRKNYYVREFEKDCANYFLSENALAVSSGTAAIKTALIALGVKPGDEVITQAFNFIATIEAIVDTGAVPVIVGIDESLNMNPEEVIRSITDKTKVILPVHMLGVPANLSALKEIAQSENLILFEDSCESVGGKYKDKWLGTIGDVGVFSFDYGKNITCGEGGLILTNDSTILEKAKQYHDHGHMNLPDVPRGMDKAGMPGFNYRMTEMQAVIGQVQLSKLDFIITENKKRFEMLETLGDRFELRMVHPDATPSYDTFIFKVEDSELREKIVHHLNEEGFGTKNLPDAMLWHCAFYWRHILPDEQVQRAKETELKLVNYIAIPIWLKKSVEEYKELSVAIGNL